MMKVKKKVDKQSDRSLTIINHLFDGDVSDRRAFFAFNNTTSEDEVLFKFNLFVRYFYPKFFSGKDAEFHKLLDLYNLRVYSYDGDPTDIDAIKYFVNIIFRAGAKTTRTKLFIVFAICNDEDVYRKFYKVLCKDAKNSKQIVTDLFNLLIKPDITNHYPEIFKETSEKREKKMGAFTTTTGIKVLAGTVGTDQRGDVQEEQRPDFVWFDDFETRKTLRSATETKTIWDNMEEARTGLSKTGVCIYTCNYVSERGNVHKLVTEKKSKLKKIFIVPIIKDGKPTWSRFSLADIEQIKLDSDDFEGEFLCEPSAGKDTYFDRDTLNKQIPGEPIKVINHFKIFSKFSRSHRYGGGHDVSLGVGLDSSTSVFIDFSVTPNRVAATYANDSIKPTVFGDEIIYQADRFGECVVAPEVNNPGISVMDKLHLRDYPNIYVRPSKADGTEIKETKKYGWHTNGFSKPLMMGDLQQAIHDGHLDLVDPDLIQEAKSYTNDDLMDKEGDARLTTRHFDLLIACAIAWQMRWVATRTSKQLKTLNAPDDDGYVPVNYDD